MPVGGRTQWAVGGPPDADAREVRAPAGIVEYEPAEMTVRVRAGTTVAELDAALGRAPARPSRCPTGRRDGRRRARGRPQRPAPPRLGPGPRHVARGALRVGRRPAVKAGGPTVKNVTGYDLCRLLVGSLGTSGSSPRSSCAPGPSRRSRAMVRGRRVRPVRGCGRAARAVLGAVGRDHHLGAARGPPGRRRGRTRPRSAPGFAEVDGPPALPPAGVVAAARAHCATLHGRVRGRDRRRHGAPSPRRCGRVAVEPAFAALHRRVKAGLRSDRPAQPRARGGAREALGRRRRAGLVRACGLCLPHCPTYRVTGEEAARRAAASRPCARCTPGARRRRRLRRVHGRCVQCRGCETACPSAVPFGRLMEGTRATLATQARLRPAPALAGARPPPAAARPGHRRSQSSNASASCPGASGCPRLPLRRPRLHAERDRRVALHRVRDGRLAAAVHAATQRVIEATGAGVALPGAGAACCGALHIHAGLARRRRTARRARRWPPCPATRRSSSNSAGCGAQLKDYGICSARRGRVRPGARHPRVAGAARRPAALAEAAAVPCGRAGSVPSPPRAAGPHRRAHGAGARSSTSSSSTTRACAAAPAGVLDHAARAGRRHRELQVASIERTGAAGGRQRQPRVLLHLAAAGRRRAPSRSSSSAEALD